MLNLDDNKKQLISFLFSRTSLAVFSIVLYYFLTNYVKNISFFTLHEQSLIKIGILIVVTVLIASILHKKIEYIKSICDFRYFILVSILWLVLTVSLKSIAGVYIYYLAILMIVFDKKTIFNYIFLWLGIFLFISVFLSYIGILVDDTFIKTSLKDGGNTYKTVRAFGLSNPNTAMIFIVGWLLTGAYLFNRSSHRKRYVVFFILVILFAYAATGSRGGLLMGAGFLFFYLYNLKFKPKQNQNKILLIAILVLVVFSSFFIAISYNGKQSLLNNILTTRPYTWNLRVKNGELFNIVGGKDDASYSDANSSPLDNFYIYMVANSGWLVFMIFIIFMLLGLSRNNDNALYPLLFALLIYGMFESNVLSPIVGSGLILILYNSLTWSSCTKGIEA